MIKVNHILTTILLAAASLAHAETQTAAPGDQGISATNRNMVKVQENIGLQNASGQLEQNKIKHTEQEEARTEYREKKMSQVELRAQKHDTATRPIKIERPGK